MNAPARVTYEQLLAAPELASLAVLEAVLDVAGVALAAAPAAALQWATSSP